MFRTRAIPALRTASRQTCNARPATRRYLTTEPPHLKSRSWKSSALRWGIAVAGIYYYNTSPVFAEHPQSNLLNPDVDAIDSDSPTIDRLLESSKQNSKHKSTLQSAIETGSQKQVEQTEENHAALQSISHADESSQSSDDGLNEVLAAAGAADLEEEAAGEGAFNPVTGEINWDCPCLGGMAYGPCGEEFRTAFSCFVYSTDEPKGMDCVEKFGAMQDCFRAHPEVYAGEIDEDESEDMGEEKELLRKEIEEKKEQAQQIQKDKEEQVKPKTQKQEKKEKKPQQDAKKSTDPEEAGKSQIVRKPKTKKVDDVVSESENLVPKAAHDATQMDEGATHSVAR